VSADGKPAIIARREVPGQPMVCLYAHYDVQPTGELSQWSSDPFEVDQRDGRWFGRGVADDKGGLAVHLAALRAFAGTPPVGITLFVEGEEEIGSPSLAALLAQNADSLAADVFVIADSVNWAAGVPAFTTTLRGLIDCVVEVSTLDHALHSGQYGGIVPDALTVLCRLLATLHDERGDVAIAGLVSGRGPALEYPPERLAQETGVLPGVQYLGRGPATDQIWTKPSVTVLAIDATSVAQASNTLAPSAQAKISVRLAPGDTSASAMRALRAHLEANVSWGAHVRVTDGSAGEPAVVPFEGPVAAAALAAFSDGFGVAPVFVGQGGSIPMVADFQTAFPEASILVTGVCDPDSRMHGADESLRLDDFGKACLAEALFLARLAR
ncbi:MAG: M20/M25/M40 family metallo-hydrolase, partial [Micropruina sp.]